MTLPANIRINMSAPFPATVRGSGAIAIVKQSGIWTVSLNYKAFGLAQTVPDPANTYVLVWNALTGVFTLIPMTAIANTKAVKQLVAAASPYAAIPSDDVLLIENVPFTVTVDWSQRLKPLQVVDGSGAASVANPITITPKAGQSQMATVNFSYLIDGAGGSIILTPLPNGTGAY